MRVHLVRRLSGISPTWGSKSLIDNSTVCRVNVPIGKRGTGICGRVMGCLTENVCTQDFGGSRCITDVRGGLGVLNSGG